MLCELSQRFYFESAHTLRRTVDAQGSRRVHGHTYHAEIFVQGEVDPASGMLVDLAEMRAAIARVREKLDHHFLDEVQDLGPATLENLCRFIYTQLAPELPLLHAVVVERPASGDKCRYVGASGQPLGRAAPYS
jgi:6-pyruvoyltetrahydropterin/6-carboxytetrahydropterin synthase